MIREACKKEKMISKNFNGSTFYRLLLFENSVFECRKESTQPESGVHFTGTESLQVKRNKLDGSNAAF